MARKEPRGRILHADDPDWDAARKVFNDRFDRRPEAIVYCADADDVAAALAWAKGVRPAAFAAFGRPQLRRLLGGRGRHRARPLAPARGRGRRRESAGADRRRPPHRPDRRGALAPWPDPAARHLPFGRHRRAHPGRRHGPAVAALGPHLRQPAQGRAGARRRQHDRRHRGGESRSAVGLPRRRRRQLRHRHLLHVPPPPDRHGVDLPGGVAVGRPARGAGRLAGVGAHRRRPAGHRAAAQKRQGQGDRGARPIRRPRVRAQPADPPPGGRRPALRARNLRAALHRGLPALRRLAHGRRRLDHLDRHRLLQRRLGLRPVAAFGRTASPSSQEILRPGAQRHLPGAAREYRRRGGPPGRRRDRLPAPRRRPLFAAVPGRLERAGRGGRAPRPGSAPCAPSCNPSSPAPPT